jgi:hypothetical protein
MIINILIKGIYSTFFYMRRLMGQKQQTNTLILVLFITFGVVLVAGMVIIPAIQEAEAKAKPHVECYATPLPSGHYVRHCQSEI